MYSPLNVHGNMKNLPTQLGGTRYNFTNRLKSYKIILVWNM